MLTRSWHLCFLLLLLTACDRSESIKDDTAPSTPSPSPESSPSPQGTYLFHWQVEGEFNKMERTLSTRVYELQGDRLEELGLAKDTILIGHQAGLSQVRHTSYEVKGCGACNESDPVAACAKDPSLLTPFTEDRLLITLPDEKVRTQALLPAPSATEAIAFHTPHMDYHGQLGPYLFVTYRLSQMPCYADGNNTFVEYAALDVRNGERVELLTKQQLQQAGKGDVAIAAIGQANAMHEGFDGELSLEAVQFYLEGSTPNAVYFYASTCGEPCSGMVDVTQDVTVELPSVILPEVYASKVDAPPAPIAALLDTPNPARLAHGWSTLPIDDDSKRRVDALLE